MKILICGLPGTGKTTLARALGTALSAPVFDGDYVRNKITLNNSFTEVARLRQAEAMASIADPIVTAGGNVICSFICPTERTRTAFGADYIIWMDRTPCRDLGEQHFEPPLCGDTPVLILHDGATVRAEVLAVIQCIRAFRAQKGGLFP